MKRLALIVALLPCAAPSLNAQEKLLASQPDTVAFSYKFPGVPVPEWGIEIYRDDKGRYWEASPAIEANPAGKTWRDIEVSEPTRRRMLSAYPAVLAGKCETRTKNVANSGRKELTYAFGTAMNSCVFNISDDKGVTASLETFMAVAETIQLGEQLEEKHRYDRLGLDAVMTTLLDELKDGRAIELPNIVRTLKRLADDPEVLQRVRSRAVTLLGTLPGYAPSPR
jgi:hypothetical protein